MVSDSSCAKYNITIKMAKFLDFDNLVANTIYTVTSMQWLYDGLGGGFFYIITLACESGNFSMSVFQNSPSLLGLYNKLDSMRLSNTLKQFKFEKVLITIEDDHAHDYLVIEGVNAMNPLPAID